MREISIHRLVYGLLYPEVKRLLEIPTHLTDREKIVLYRLASRLSHTITGGSFIVEIGSYYGASASFLAAGLKKSNPHGKLFCIDTWENDAMTEGSRSTLAEFHKNIAAYSEIIVPIRGYSCDKRVRDQVAAAPGKISLLFIDGDHSYEGVLADWEAYSPMLSEYAVVAIHDISWAEGVQRVLQDQIRPRAVRERRLPNLWWGWVNN